MKTALPHAIPRPEPEIRTIAAGEFKAKCLQLMDDVAARKLTLVVTKRGKPVAQVTAPAPEEQSFRSIVGIAPNIKILGDIISPLPQEWTLPEWVWEKPAKRGARARKKA